MEVTQIVATVRRVPNDAHCIVLQFLCDVMRARVEEEGDVVDVTNAMMQFTFALHLNVDVVVTVQHQAVICKNMATSVCFIHVVTMF